MKNLTELAHRYAAATLSPGDFAVDGTAGNGHDTLFLAQLVGPGGHVDACDIQAPAIAATAQRLAAAGCHNVTLYHASHARLDQLVPPQRQGRIALAMFNLGYLPGGDKEIVTTSSTTILALQAVWKLLQPEGWLSVLAYRGHPGGWEEAQAVANALHALPQALISVHDGIPDLAGQPSDPPADAVRARLSPRLFLVQKL